MNRYQIAGVLWLVAAALGAAVTVAFRTDTDMTATTAMMDTTTSSAITFVASAIAAVIGVLLLWRPSSTTVLLSTIGGVAWVAIYGALTVLQYGETGWATDLGLALVGAVAAVVAYRAQSAAQPGG
jgi:hypothetical protein